MILLTKLPEEAELEFRMRYSNVQEVMTFFFEEYETLSLSETTLRGYVECKTTAGAVHIDIDGKKFLPWRTTEGHGDVVITINDGGKYWWNFSYDNFVSPERSDYRDLIDKDIYISCMQFDKQSPRLEFEMKLL